MENPMLNHELGRDDGILVVKPEEPIAAADFTTLASHVDAYLEQHGALRGVLIHARAFPGWKDFDALLAHQKFIKEHHRKIGKVAVVADDGFAMVMPFIASHFVHAQVKHFDHAQDEDAVWDWLMDDGSTQIRTPP
jgi:hypothetical protein